MSGKQAHGAGGGADFVHQRGNGHAQHALGQIEVALDGLAVGHDAVEIRPDAAVGDDLQPLVAGVFLAGETGEHAIQRRVVVRDAALGVHGHDALGKTVEHLL